MLGEWSKTIFKVLKNRPKQKRREAGLCVSLYWGAQCGHSVCCITLTPGPPYSQSRGTGGGGDEGRENRFLRNWHHPLPPFSPELPLLFILSFSLSLLYSALLCDWPDHDGNQPGPSVKASPPPFPLANFFSFPCNTQLHPLHILRLTTETSRTFKGKKNTPPAANNSYSVILVLKTHFAHTVRTNITETETGITAYLYLNIFAHFIYK